MLKKLNVDLTLRNDFPNYWKLQELLKSDTTLCHKIASCRGCISNKCCPTKENNLKIKISLIAEDLGYILVDEPDDPLVDIYIKDIFENLKDHSSLENTIFDFFYDLLISDSE